MDLIVWSVKIFGILLNNVNGGLILKGGLDFVKIGSRKGQFVSTLRQSSFNDALRN